MKDKKTPEEEVLDSLERLNRNQDFNVFRDKYAKPIIEQIENDLKDADKHTEAILRGKLKHYFSMKAHYHEVFENIKLQRKMAKQIKNK